MDVVDLFWFGNALPPEVRIINRDLFDLQTSDLKEYDQVIFLAGLSNDPMAEYSPSKNFKRSKRKRLIPRNRFASGMKVSSECCFFSTITPAPSLSLLRCPSSLSLSRSSSSSSHPRSQSPSNFRHKTLPLCTPQNVPSSRPVFRLHTLIVRSREPVIILVESNSRQ